MAGFWSPQDQPSTRLQPSIAVGAPTGALENREAAVQDVLLSNDPMSNYNNLMNAYQERVHEVYQATGKKLRNPLLTGTGPGLFKDAVIPGGTEKFRRNEIMDFEGQIDELRKDHPQLTTYDDMVRRVSTRSINAEENATEVNNRATFAGKVGGLAGTMEGYLRDPVNLLTLPFGAAKGAGILRAALTEATIALGTETAVQPQIQSSRIERGQEGGVAQGLENIAGAAGSTFVGGVALRGIAHLAGSRLLNKFDSTVKNPTPEQSAARDLYAHVTEINETSPLDSAVPGAIEEHNARLMEAMKSIESGQPAALPAQAVAPVSATAVSGNLDNLDGIVWKFKPADIETDAKAFQFKEGGDDAGVTERLKGITEWDPVKAGQVIVFQDDAGRQFIADGHQRLGLAQRLQAANPDKNIPIYGTLFKAQDGFTPEMVRVVAAMKNIAEGTGSAIDAAKVLRIAPARIAELPPNSALVRQAGDMVNLSDHAFGMVINEVVPANYGAIVGRLVHEPQLQEAIMEVLAKTEPANAVQAESIVRQAIDAGTHTEIRQGGLFGDEVITSSLFAERAKVLDKGLKKLRQDAKVFETLIRNEDSIASEGNVLSRNANEARAQTDARAVQMIQTLANRKGPLSDALTQAARRAADEGKYPGATGDFIAAVRSAIERGDFDGITAGDAGRYEQATAENAARIARGAEARPDEQALKLFAEPGGQGSELQARALEADLRRELAVEKTAAGDQTVLPGAEAETLKETAERKADDKIKPAVKQQAADHGLFDEAGRSQMDLLDEHIPSGLRVDPETGDVHASTQTIREILDELDADAADLDAIGKCGKP